MLHMTAQRFVQPVSAQSKDLTYIGAALVQLQRTVAGTTGC